MQGQIPVRRVAGTRKGSHGRVKTPECPEKQPASVTRGSLNTEGSCDTKFLAVPRGAWAQAALQPAETVHTDVDCLSFAW